MSFRAKRRRVVERSEKSRVHKVYVNEILHYVQDDTKGKYYLFLLIFNSTKKAVSKPRPPKISTQAP